MTALKDKSTVKNMQICYLAKSSKFLLLQRRSSLWEFFPVKLFVSDSVWAICVRTAGLLRKLCVLATDWTMRGGCRMANCLLIVCTLYDLTS